jgi:osmotically inducible protein OsmC
MKRTAKAQWSGDLKAGKGNISTASGVLTSTQYSFGTRFEEGKGTNPEELLAAAHAGCFTMALSAQLGLAGLTAESLETACTITFEKLPDGFEITESHLELKAKVPGASEEAFEKAVQNAKTGCPVSKRGTCKIPVSLNSRLTEFCKSNKTRKRYLCRSPFLRPAVNFASTSSSIRRTSR